MNQEINLTVITEKYESFFERIEEYGKSLFLEKKLSDHISMLIIVPDKFKDLVSCDISTIIHGNTPEVIIEKMKELIWYRNELQKRDYMGELDLDQTVIDYEYHIGYKYYFPNITDKQNIFKIIEDLTSICKKD